jgi:hypothetical protein
MSTTKATANIASGWLDLASFADLDNRLYDGEEVTLLHSKDITPVSFGTRIAVPLKATGQANSASYALAKSADYAGNMFYRFTTPDITVVQAQQALYRVAFSPNFGHWACPGLQFTVNDIPIVKLDPVSMDLLSEANLEGDKFSAYSRIIGNVNKALNFSSHIPPITVKKHLHELWFCQKSVSDPREVLALCALKHNTLAVTAEFVESLGSLLRVQKNLAANPGVDPENWQDVSPNSVDLSAILQVSGSSGLRTPLPELWCEYVLVTDEERAMVQSKTIDVLIKQYQAFTSARLSVGSSRVTFHFSYPMRYLLFAAQNKTASDNNYFSNYSTNSADAGAGLDPIRRVTLWYDNTARFQNVYADQFSDMEYLYHAARVPESPGHHLLAYCYNTASNEIDLTSNFSRLATDLEVEINETSTDSSDPATSPCAYTLEIRGESLNLVRLQGGALAFPSFQG